MADLSNRSQYEAELAAKVAEILRQHRAEIERGIDPPEAERRLRTEFLLLFGLVFVVGSRTAAGELGIAVEAQNAGRRWGDVYGASVSRGVMDAVRKRVEKARAKDLTGELGLVKQTVEKLIDGNTWNNFAATEVTRANTAGGEFTAFVYNSGRVSRERPQPFVGEPITPELSPDLVPVEPEPPSDEPTIPEPALALWHTSRDDKVCPRCRPLHGRPREEWQLVAPMGPPLHVACRCYIDYALEASEAYLGESENRDGEKGVWRTIRGAKVFIKDGKITKGPKALIDKTPDEVESDEKPKRKRKSAASKPDKVKDDSSKPEPEPKDDKPKGKVKQTDTAEFKAWFGDSKAVDKNGKPLVVYHGTRAPGFGEFDPSKASTAALYGPGVYLTEAPDIASEYASRTGGVYPVYARIESPLDLDAPATDGMKAKVAAAIRSYKVAAPKKKWEAKVNKSIDAALEKLADASGSNNDILKAMHGAQLGLRTVDGPDGKVMVYQEFSDAMNAEVLSRGGFDGLTHVGGKIMGNKEHRVWIAFTPNQIKSATGNRGTFSRKSNRIDEQHHGA